VFYTYTYDDDVSEYHSRIGVLRWAVKLGRIDICTEVSIMAAYATSPRKKHSEAVYHIFAYLMRHDRSRLLFDASRPNSVEQSLPDWMDFYKDVKEQIPKDTPEPLGKSVEMTAHIDSDRAGDKVTWRSRTGVLIFLNRSPIRQYNKKQSSIKMSSIGSEFSAIKTGTELIEGPGYKLRMMGIPIDGPCHVKANNLSVVRNSSQPESTFKKKLNLIALHYVREPSAQRRKSLVFKASLGIEILRTCQLKFSRVQRSCNSLDAFCFNFDSLSFCVSFFIGKRPGPSDGWEKFPMASSAPSWVHHRTEMRLSIAVMNIISCRGQLRWIRASPKSA